MKNDNGKYRVAVLADNGNLYAANMLTFETETEAETYARDLWSRWTAVRSWGVIPIDLKPDSGSYWTSDLIEAEAVKRSGQ